MADFNFDQSKTVTKYLYFEYDFREETETVLNCYLTN